MSNNDEAMTEFDGEESTKNATASAPTKRESEILHEQLAEQTAKAEAAEVTLSARIARDLALETQSSPLLQRQHDERIEALAAEKARLEAENVSLQRQHDERIEDIAVLMRRTENEAAQLRDQLAAAETSRVKSRSRAKALVNEKTALEAEVAALVRRIAEVAAEAEARLTETHQKHAGEIRALFESTSWRITKPVRSVKLALSRKA